MLCGFPDQGLGMTQLGALGKGSCGWKAVSGVWSAGCGRRWRQQAVAYRACKVRSLESYHGRGSDVG